MFSHKEPLSLVFPIVNRDLWTVSCTIDVQKNVFSNMWSEEIYRRTVYRDLWCTIDVQKIVYSGPRRKNVLRGTVYSGPRRKNVLRCTVYSAPRPEECTSLYIVQRSVVGRMYLDVQCTVLRDQRNVLRCTVYRDQRCTSMYMVECRSLPVTI